MKKMKLKRFLVSLILIIITLTSYTMVRSTEDTKYIDYPIEYKHIKEYDVSVDIQRENVKERLIMEVKSYIGIQSPKANKKIPEHLVAKCLDENIDICFAMSQTEIETNYGTTGAGRACSRKSMFGVARRSYPNYLMAINDYIVVLKKHYLKNGRTEIHLMNNYVTVNGARYAQDKSYEKNIKTTYNKIKTTTDIYKLQKKYNNI